MNVPRRQVVRKTTIAALANRVMNCYFRPQPMHRATLGIILIGATCLLAGCRSPRETETSELRHGLRQQMRVVRTQLQTSGASSAQLREFDRVASALDRQMRQLERKIQAMEEQTGER
jgi:hypothetical protein